MHTHDTNTHAGIDYGLGQTNIDPVTGIRYGVISGNGDILQAWADSSEADYGDPHCPKCGNDAGRMSDNDAPDTDGDEWTQARGECADYYCVSCRLTFGSESAFGDEAIGYALEDAEYTAVSCLDSDVMITRSPYYTRARFCSPCVPGAGDLNSPDPQGIKAYCFGPDWYDTEDGLPPFGIWRVSDDSIVVPWPEDPDPDTDQRVIKARALGFQAEIIGTRVRVTCDSCDTTVINGIPCHETGCRRQTYPCHECDTGRATRPRGLCEDCANPLEDDPVDEPGADPDTDTDEDTE